MNKRYLINYQKGGKPLDLVFYDIFKDVLLDDDKIKFSNMFALDYVNSFKNGIDFSLPDSLLKENFQNLLNKYNLDSVLLKEFEKKLKIIRGFQKNKFLIKRLKDEMNAEIENSRNISNMITLDYYQINNTIDLINFNLNKYTKIYQDLYYQIKVDMEIINDLSKHFGKNLNYDDFKEKIEYYRNFSKYSSWVKKDINKYLNYIIDDNYYENFIFKIQKINNNYIIKNLKDNTIIDQNDFKDMFSKTIFYKVHDDNIMQFKTFINQNYSNILKYKSILRTNLIDILFDLKKNSINLTKNDLYKNLNFEQIEFINYLTLDDILVNFGKIINQKGTKFIKDSLIKNQITNKKIFYNESFKPIEEFFNKTMNDSYIVDKSDFNFFKNFSFQELKEYYFIDSNIFKFETEEANLSIAIILNQLDTNFFKIFDKKYQINDKEYSFNSIKYSKSIDVNADGNIYENYILNDAYKRILGILNQNYKNIMISLKKLYYEKGDYKKYNNYNIKLNQNIYKTNTLRVLNGYTYESIVTGELDLLIIDDNNNLLAVGEIKSYLDGAVKAYYQLQKFREFILDKNYITVTKDDQSIDINIVGDFKDKLINQPENNKYFFMILKDSKFSNIPEGNQIIYSLISNLIRENKITFDGNKFTNIASENDKNIQEYILKSKEKLREYKNIRTLTILDKYKNFKNNLIIY